VTVSPMLYFAYGSNMLLEQMRDRCPSAAFVGNAALEGYRLAFTRTAKRNWKGYGVADVVLAPGHSVWGAVFQIEEHDIGALDRSEGYRPDREQNAYRRIEVHVYCDGDAAKPLATFTYVVCTREEPNPLPHRDYLERIVSGARFWNLPREYVSALERINVSK
jgi:gamma-glutamylcyclotransferase